MSTKSSVSTLAIAVTLVLAACGGGGGGSTSPPAATVTGNGVASSTGPGDTALYYPNTQGDQWFFNYVTNDPAAVSKSAVVSVAVNGTRAVKGLNATVFTRSDPTSATGGYDQYFYVNGGGATLLGNNEASDSITPLIAPYVELLFPVQVGPVSTVTAMNLPFGQDASGHALTLDLSQQITNVATESVDVPAGSFTNAMHQRTTVSGTGHANGQSTPAVSGTEDTWLVPGIGLVKDQASVGGSGTAVNSAAELRGYTVNGVAHGLGSAAVTLPNLVSANCVGGSTFFVPTHLASDGTEALSVALSCDNSSGSTRVKWVATLIGSNGAVKSTTDLTPATNIPAQTFIGLHAAVAFDGTNFLVIHEDNYAVGNVPNLLASLVSINGTVLAGPNVVGVASDYDYFPSDTLALAFDGSRYLLAISSDPDVHTQGQLAGQFISPVTALADGSPFPISSTPIYVRDGPALGFDGTNYLVVWGENGLAPTGLRAMRIAKTGALLDATPLLVMDDTGAGTNSSGVCCDLSPSVTFDGTNYLVAYRDPRGAAPYTNAATVSAARVSPTGALLDGTASVPGIVVASARSVVVDRVRSAFIGGAHWLVWGSGSPSLVNATRVSTSGRVPSAWSNGFTLVPNGASTPTAQLPAIAPSANGAVVTWLQAPTSMSSPTALWDMPIYSSGP